MTTLLALAVAAASATGPVAEQRGGASVTVRASARVVHGAAVRQGEVPDAQRPAVQVSRRANGEILLEFT